MLGQVFSELIFEGKDRIEEKLATGLVFFI
jgi:hypothetical protein